MNLVNSLAPAYDAFLGLWSHLPQPIVALAYTVLSVLIVRSLIHFVNGN